MDKVQRVVNMINAELSPKQVQSMLELDSLEREKLFIILMTTNEERTELWKKYNIKDTYNIENVE